MPAWFLGRANQPTCRLIKANEELGNVTQFEWLSFEQAFVDPKKYSRHFHEDRIHDTSKNFVEGDTH
jgi:hypothetical protein